MDFSVFGCGRWGSFIAWYLNKLGHKVCLWGREGSKNLTLLKEQGIAGVPYPTDICLTSDLGYALSTCEAAVISISAQQLESFLSVKETAALRGKPLILCMKGLEQNTGERLSRTAARYLNEEDIAVWLGPGHVENFLAGIPNCMVIDSLSPRLKEYFISSLKGPLIRFYYGTDIVGNEVGAAAKNVIGIAAGVLDGLNMSSLKGALMARGAREISRLMGKMGANPMSAYGLAHLGDYEATVFSRYSHNRAFGQALVTGEQVPFLAEGVGTAAALKVLADRYGEELPISRAVYEMIYEKKPPMKAADEIFMRDLTKEF